MERDPLVIALAANLTAAMKRRGMNAASLAKAADVNATGVYDILSGKSRSPRLDTIHKLAMALGVPVVTLFEPAEQTGARQELVELFHALPADEQRRILQIARAWSAEQKSA